MDLNPNAGLMDVRPPMLEDAGLEDSALPAHAIQEAFKRAADALQNAQRHVQVTASSVLGKVGTGEDVKAPENLHPSNGLSEDSCVDSKGSVALGENQSCVGSKGGGVQKGGDLIAGHGPGAVDGDKLVIGTTTGPKLGDSGCVEGLEGDTKEGKKEEEEEGPILVLGYD